MSGDSEGNRKETNDSDNSVYIGGAIRSTPAELAVIPRYQRLSRMASLPVKVDLSDTGDFPTAGQQGQQNSCVAWAIAYAIKTYQEQQERKWGVNTANHQFSPAFIYHQRNDGNPVADNGMTVWEGLEIVWDKGVCTLADMPYNPNDHRTPPTQAQLNSAMKFRAHDCYYIDNSNISDIKHVINSRNPVLILVPMYQDLRNINARNPVYDRIKGAYLNDNHAMCIVGYDDNYQCNGSKGAFKVINSWGTGWGINGYGYISYRFISERSDIVECYAMEDKIDVRDISLNKHQMEVVIGEQEQLQVDYTPANATNKGVTYTSLNNSVAAVSLWGKVKANSIGNTDITVKSNDPDSLITKNCHVKVTDAKVSLNKGNLELLVGESQVITKTVQPANNITSNAIWTSSNPAVATINSSTGRVTAIAAGEAVISVKCNYQNSNAVATCLVKVRTPDDSIIISDTLPDRMVAGEIYHVSVTFKNNGVKAWNPANGIGYGQYCLGTGANNNTDGALFLNGAKRVTLARATAVNAGEICLVNMTMTAPAPGIYHINLKMLNNESNWFGALLEKTIMVVEPGSELTLNTYGSAGTFKNQQLTIYSHHQIRNDKLKNYHSDAYGTTHSQMGNYTQKQLREGEI